jgi:hypothetical protein
MKKTSSFYFRLSANYKKQISHQTHCMHIPRCLILMSVLMQILLPVPVPRPVVIPVVCPAVSSCCLVMMSRPDVPSDASPVVMSAAALMPCPDVPPDAPSFCYALRLSER